MKNFNFSESVDNVLSSIYNECESKVKDYLKEYGKITPEYTTTILNKYGEGFKVDSILLDHGEILIETENDEELYYKDCKPSAIVEVLTLTEMYLEDMRVRALLMPTRIG